MIDFQTNPLGCRTTCTWNAYGQKLTWTNPLACRWTYGFDPKGRASLTFDPTRVCVTTSFDPCDRAIVSLDVLGRCGTHVYDAANQLQATVAPDGTRLTFLYDAAGHATEVIENTGLRTTTLYDPLGRPYATIDVLGLRTTTVFDAAGHPVAVVGPTGTRTTTLYDLAGRVQAVINPLGQIATTTYWPTGQVKERMDALGSVWTTTYWEDGLLKEEIAPDGGITTHLYDLATRPTQVIDPLGYSTQTVYDPAGRVTKVIDAVGIATTVVYDAAGQPIQTLDGRGFLSQVVYDGAGRAQVAVNALGYRTTTVFDASGIPVATIDPLGFRTTTVYDSAGRPQATIDALGARTTTVYDGHGRVQAAIDARGYRTTTLFDDFGRAVATQDPLGYLTTSLFDAFGRVRGTLDPAGFSTDTSFDLLDRPEARIDAMGNRTTTVYRATGQVEATIDALGRRTTTVYDSLGRAIAQVSPLGDRTTFTYSLRGDRLAVTNARGYTQTALFDGLGRAYAQIDALGRRTTLTFDETGNVTKQVDGKGQVETRVYDALGRNTGVQYGDGTRVTATFDALGRALTQANQNGIWTRTYDAVGQMLTENGPGHPFGHPLTSVYDLAGNRTGLITWRGRETWSYDARNQTQSMVDIESGRFTWSYEARGLLSRLDYANGALMTAAYDGDGRTLQLRHARASGSQLAFVATSYDAVGNVTTLKRPNTANYSYDLANQLLTENHPSRGLTTWSYDPAGNRVTALLPSNQRITWSYDAADQLTLEQKCLPGQTPWAITATFSYDLNGNRTLEQFGERFDEGWSNATATYPWDPANRLLQVLHNISTGTDQTDTYRPDGLRAKKVDGGATAHMIWDQSDLLAQVDASGNVLQFWSRGATLVKQRNPSGGTYTQAYLHLDPQGSLLIRSQDDNSAIGAVLDPDPWGGDPTKRWGRSVVDSFTRPDGALGSTETGQDWTDRWSPTSEATSGFGVVGKRASVGPHTADCLFWSYCDSNLADVRVKVRLTLGGVSGKGVGLLFRVDSTGGGLMLRYTGGSSNNWHWSKLSGLSGSVTDYATFTGPELTLFHSYDLEVRANGSSCTAYVEGAQIGGTQTITDHQTDTSHGFYSYVDWLHKFDNFSVMAEPEAVGWLGDPGYYTEGAVMRPLSYVRARWYQAGGPGWVSKDPIGLRGGDINLYRYVGNRPLVAIDPSGMARSPVPMRPPGDCSWAEHNALQDVVDAACSVPRACTKASPTDCNTILLYIDRNFTCATARRAINVKCYRGGDDTHRPMEEEAWTALAHCTQEYAYKCGGSRRRVPVTVPVTVPVPVPGSSPCVRHQPVSGGIPTGVVVVGAGILIVGGVALILLSGGAAAPAVAEVGAGALPFLTAAAAAAR